MRAGRRFLSRHTSSIDFPRHRARTTGIPSTILKGMPKLLDRIYQLQDDFPDLDGRERLLLKMCANLLEDYYEAKNPRNRLTDDEYFKVPGRWELYDGMLRDY